MPIYIYANFSLSRDNQILKFIISRVEIMKVYNKYYINTKNRLFAITMICCHV